MSWADIMDSVGARWINLIRTDNACINQLNLAVDVGGKDTLISYFCVVL